MSLADEVGPAGAPARRPSPTLGALTLSAANVLRLGVQLAMLPILARLVGPAEYGLVALAVPFVLFCNMLADAGLSQALARRQDASPRLESTVFWLAGGLGLALGLLASLAAWPLGALLGQPRLPLLIVALSPILAMSGFTAAANGRVIREGRFGVFAGGDVLSTAASAGVAVWAAMSGWGAWSLVAQQLTLWSVKFLWVNGAARPHVAAGFRPSEARELVSFGLHSVGSNLADFTARNVGNLIVGGVLGATALGYFAMAYQIVRIPDLVISGPLYLYIFTAMAKTAHRGQSAGELAVSAFRLAATALAPVFVGLALIAGPAVSLVLGDKWRPAAPVLAELSAAGFGFSICLVAGAILMALGRSHLQFRLSLLAALVTIGAAGVFSQVGLEAASMAIGVGIVGVMAAYLIVVGRDLQTGTRRLAAAFVPALLGAVALAGALLLLRPLIAHQHVLAQLAAMIAVGGAAYAGVVLGVAGRTLVADGRRLAAAHG